MLTALYADKKGEIFDAPGIQAVGRVGYDEVKLHLEDMIPMPEGAVLAFLPGRTALGISKDKIAPIQGKVLAVAVMLPAGYTRTHVPAFLKHVDAPILPLYGYAAAALYNDEIYVAAVKSDENEKWHPYSYNTPDLKKKVSRIKREFMGNRIVEQLAHCSLKWQCCTAENLFYQRWEAGIPTSPVCNANCFGCISLQPSECCPSPQKRIDFIPTPEEIAAVGTFHLGNAPEGIISFGQGCEGEPSLSFENIAAAMKLIRVKTKKGMININTNAGFTKGIKAIVDAGLDSMRVSIISAIPEVYQAYYRSNYTLDHVRESIAYAKQKGVYVSLNMLTFPGLNDRPEEVKAWIEFIKAADVDMIQLRNLNVDPDAFLEIMPESAGTPIGIRQFIDALKHNVPRLAIGSFSHYKK